MNGHNETLEELSHAWLHLLAARAGFIYERSGRQADNSGIDATVLNTATRSVLLRLRVGVQLRATGEATEAQPLGIPFRLRLLDYDRLRASTAAEPLLLVVVFFPADPAIWALEGNEGIVLQARGYWMDLRGAMASSNQSYQTVYLPLNQRFTSDGLREAMEKFSRELERILAGGEP